MYKRISGSREIGARIPKAYPTCGAAFRFDWTIGIDGAMALFMSLRAHPFAHEDAARREQIAVDIVADAMIALLVSQRLRELDARDAVAAADADERAREDVRSAIRRGMRIGRRSSTGGGAFSWR